jgi:hypothetical protein
VIGFQEVITEPELLAVDPATFGFDKLKLELAKSVAATLRIVEIFLRHSSEMNFDLINANQESSHAIETIIPTLPAGDIEGKKTLLARASHEGKIILDASLRVSEIEEWREAGAKIIAFDKNLRPRDLPQELSETFTWENYLESDSIKNALQAGGLVFASSYELDDAPRILMSLQWHQLVRELSMQFPLIIVTPTSQSMSNYPDVALASWHGSARPLNVNYEK